jgi:hypothetical protein
LNNDLTQTDNVITTRNPQDSTQTVTGPSANDFQPSATQEVLTRNQTLKVVPNGEPITEPPANSPDSPFLLAAIIVGLIGIALLLLWRKRRPVAASLKTIESPVKLEAKPTVEIKKKKKMSRAERNKAAHH